MECPGTSSRGNRLDNLLPLWRLGTIPNAKEILRQPCRPKQQWRQAGELAGSGHGKLIDAVLVRQRAAHRTAHNEPQRVGRRADGREVVIRRRIDARARIPKDPPLPRCHRGAAGKFCQERLGRKILLGHRRQRALRARGEAAGGFGKHRRDIARLVRDAPRDKPATATGRGQPPAEAALPNWSDVHAFAPSLAEIRADGYRRRHANEAHATRGGMRRLCDEEELHPENQRAVRQMPRTYF